MSLEFGNESTKERYKSLPGLNLFVAFINTDLTYEDGVVMSVSAARKFKYLCMKRITLALGSKFPTVGSFIDPFSKFHGGRVADTIRSHCHSYLKQFHRSFLSC